ncbi:MAG: hypothetical protein ACI9FB_002687 [Candidatus Azotimanducaceae bacterium]
MSDAGVSGALSDPSITLFSGQTPIDSNDNWADHPNQNLIPAHLKLNHENESIIAINLKPGPYTAIVSGVNQEQGIGLAEVFEIDTNGDARLLNLAARAQISTGDSVLISGLIVAGTGKKRFIVRAKGPSLTQNGLENILPDPQLTLLSGQTVIAGNNDWNDDNQANRIPDIFKPSSELEAVILVELDPGAYTAIVNDLNSNSGIGIVEVFDLGAIVPIVALINDTITTTENELISIDVLANDENTNSSTLNVSLEPSHGVATIVSNKIDYVPAQGFTGQDALQYSVSDDSGLSFTANVSITIDPFIPTTLARTSLSISSTNYTQLNDAELNSTVLTSPLTLLNIPDDTVSYSMTLQGDDVDDNGENLFIASLVNPSASGPSPIQRNVLFCDAGLCSALVPRNPSISVEAGNWKYSLGTLEDSLTSIDLNNLTLDIVVRKGPLPNLQANFPATLKIRPFLTSSSISEEEITSILSEIGKIAIQNKIKLEVEPITVITEARFEEVSSNFEDTDTAELVTMGDPDKINLFFLESFSGSNGGGLLGISGGLPGTMGIKGKFNGVLINATATRGGPDDFYVRTTAEITFHEMGHFLGLFHTTERLFGIYDVIDDTPECTAAEHDTNSNRIADISECPDGFNLMFWNIDLSTPKEVMSSDQKTTIYYSPIATP